MPSSALLATLLVLLALPAAWAQEGGAEEKPVCRLTLFPHQVRTPQGVVQMTAEQLSDATFTFVTDAINSRKVYMYEVGVRLLKPINPRLCRWRGVDNEDEALWFNDDAFDRKPLTAANGFPSVRCMITKDRPGAPVNFYPPFTRAGTLAPPTSMAGFHPLCGDLFGFRAGTMLKLRGNIELGVTKVLECQSGKPEHADQYLNVPILQAQCDRAPPKLLYENARNVVSDRIFSSLARKQQLDEAAQERESSRKAQQAALAGK